MPREPSAIPVGTQFSSSRFDLREFIKALCDHSGDKAALMKVIWAPPVFITTRKRAPTRRNKSLPLEAAAQYGLLGRRTYVATDLARELSALSGQDLYEAFARHILLNLGGLRVVEACQQMRVDALQITGDTLARYLTDQAFRVTEHNTQINTMRLWLAKAGIFPDQSRGHDIWEVDVAAKERILGLREGTIEILAGLKPDQVEFALALSRINPRGEYLAAGVRANAEASSGLRLARASLPDQYLRPLEKAGLITWRSGGTAGGKSAKLKTTPAFQHKLLGQFLTHTLKDLDPLLTAYYTRRPEDIYRDLESSDTFVKGQALEAFAVQVMRLLGLRFVSWRKRAADTTGGAEIDVLMSGVFGGVPTRWQVQCKNKPAGSVDLEDVAKEIGLLPLTQATHVMVIANCRFTRDARTYADAVMAADPVAIYLLDRDDFNAIKRDPANLSMILRAKAESISRQPPITSLWRA